MKLFLIFFISSSCTSYQVREYVRDSLSSQCKSDMNLGKQCSDDEIKFNKYKDHQKKHYKIIK